MAPKRAAPQALAARPAKKGKVSDILAQAFAVLPRKELSRLFTLRVLPGISDKPFRSIFEEAVERYTPSDEEKRRNRWDAHQESLEKKGNALKKDLRRNWHDGYDDQSEMAGGIFSEVGHWLNDLFEVAIEQGSDLISAQQRLIYIEKQVLQIMHNNCRYGYAQNMSDNYDTYKCSITDTTNAARYCNTIDIVIPLLWRDLLLVATVQSNQEVLEDFTRHRKRADKSVHVRKTNRFACGYDLPTTLTSLLPYTRDPQHPEQGHRS